MKNTKGKNRIADKSIFLILAAIFTLLVFSGCSGRNGAMAERFRNSRIDRARDRVVRKLDLTAEQEKILEAALDNIGTLLKNRSIMTESDKQLISENLKSDVLSPGIFDSIRKSHETEIQTLRSEIFGEFSVFHKSLDREQREKLADIIVEYME